MKYDIPKFGDWPSVQVFPPFGSRMLTMPKFDYPISPKENFYRAMRHENPLWVPFNTLEIRELPMSRLYDKGPEGYQLGPILGDPRPRYTYFDAFGNSWTYDRNAGGSCMTLGTRICDDILKWEKQISWPDLHQWNLEERAERFVKEEYDSSKVLHIDLFHGPFQSLADFMGGFAEALEAMFIEPEACRAFFDRFADWMIWLIDKLSTLYPVDFFTVHDDWGTEKDAFFSPIMMEELLYEPTKRIIDHVHSLGKFYQFHCCGKINRFMPYFYELGTDSTQIQRRVNDLPEYKKLYGGKIGFLTPLEGWVAGKDLSDEELSEIVQNNIEIYAAGGGWLPNVYASNEQQWKIAFALYFRSLDYYENGRKPENKKCSESIPDRSHNKGSII